MKTFVAILLLSISCSPLFAQYDDIYRGVQKTHKGYYDEAIPDLEAGLQDLSVLSDKDKAKAYTHLSVSYLRAGLDPSMKPKFREPFLQALQALRKAEVADKEKTYTSTLTSLQPLLQDALFNDAARAYNDQKWKSCLSYAEESSKLDPKDYTAKALWGLTLLQQNKKQDALQQLTKAIEIYQNAKGVATSAIADAYVQATALYLQKGDPQSAQNLATEGMKRFGTFPEVIKKLTIMDLIAYEKSPNPLSRGRKAFDAAIQKYPQEYDIQRTYAALLIDQGDAKDQAKGYSMFQKIQQRFPKDYEANAYLAARLIAEANTVNASLDTGLDDKQYTETEAKVISNLEKAYPHVKAAYDSKPEEKQWLDQLVRISMYVPAFQGEHGKWLNAQNKEN